MTNRLVSVDETFTLPAPVRAKVIADLSSTSPGDVLAAFSHNPAIQEQYDGNAGAGTFTAIAPGILVVSFVAPSSGRVSVQLEMQIHSSSEVGFWALQSSGSVVPGSAVRVCGPVAQDQGHRAVATVIVSDLMPGVSYTYTWAGAAPGTNIFQMRAGGSLVGAALSGPAVMIVRETPGV